MSETAAIVLYYSRLLTTRRFKRKIPESRDVAFEGSALGASRRLAEGFNAGAGAFRQPIGVESGRADFADSSAGCGSILSEGGGFLVKRLGYLTLPI